MAKVDMSGRGDACSCPRIFFGVPGQVVMGTEMSLPELF